MADHQGPYKVVFSRHILEKIRFLGGLAINLGLGETYVADLKVVHFNLLNNPLTWGDPQFRFPRNVDLVGYHRAYGAGLPRCL